MTGMILTIETTSGEIVSGRCVRVMSDYSLALRTGKLVRIVYRKEIVRFVGRNFVMEG